jgi:uncharacterized coiled-coil protein SlyX
MAASSVIGMLPFGKNWPGWLQNVVAWFVISILTTIFTMAMVQGTSSAKLQNLEQRVGRHDQQMLTIDRFNQRDTDQVKRMDRIENKVDRLLEKR